MSRWNPGSSDRAAAGWCESPGSRIVLDLIALSAVVLLPSLGHADYAYTYWLPYRNESIGPSVTWNGLDGWSFSDSNSVGIDYDNDGTMDAEYELDSGEGFSNTEFLEGSCVRSTHPIDVFYNYILGNHGSYEDGGLSYGLLPEDCLGTDYWVPLAVNTLSILSSQDGNQISIDRDNDGSPEDVLLLDAGESVRTTAQAGDHIWCTKPTCVVAANQSNSSHSDTYAYAILPCSLLGMTYYIPHEHPYNYGSATNLSGVHIVAPSESTLIEINGDVYSLQGGDTLFYASTGEVAIEATRNVCVVYQSKVNALDPWAGVYRNYCYAFAPIPSTYGLTRSIDRGWYLPGHGGPMAELSVVSFSDGNQVAFDCLVDGVVEHTVTLDKGEFFYVHELDSVLGAWGEQQPMLIEASSPMQCIRTGRMYWAGLSEWAYGRGHLFEAELPSISEILISVALAEEEAALTWSAVPAAHAYWVYGAPNVLWFVPGMGPDHEHRVGIVVPPTTTWSSPNGVGDPNVNWTYLVIAVDPTSQVVAISKRVGEHDYAAGVP